MKRDAASPSSRCSSDSDRSMSVLPVRSFERPLCRRSLVSARLCTSHASSSVAPSPLVGEGWEGGRSWRAHHLNNHDPHPYPSPQGGGERTERLATACTIALKPA